MDLQLFAFVLVVLNLSIVAYKRKEDSVGTKASDEDKPRMNTSKVRLSNRKRDGPPGPGGKRDHVSFGKREEKGQDEQNEVSTTKVIRDGPRSPTMKRDGPHGPALKRNCSQGSSGKRDSPQGLAWKRDGPPGLTGKRDGPRVPN